MLSKYSVSQVKSPKIPFAGAKRSIGSPSFEHFTQPRTTRVGSRLSGKNFVLSMSCTRIENQAQRRKERAKKRTIESSELAAKLSK